MRQPSAAWVLGILVLGCGGDDDGPGPVDAGASGGRGGAAVSGKGGTVAGGGGAGSNANAGSHANAGSRANAGSHAGGAGAAAGGKGGQSSGGASGSKQPTGGAGVPTLDPPITPGDPGNADVTIEVRTDGSPHLIDPLIYGTNGATEIDNTHQTVVRSGGNRMTAYNWENNASNAGSDYMFENDAFLSDSTDPAKPILDGIAQATSHQAASIVTVPIVDYVSADTSPSGDVRNSGSDYLSKRFKQNKSDKGSAPAAQPDTTDAFVYQDEFVAFLGAHAASGSQIMYSLDNEPDIWSSTHAEVHPDPVTYAELWDRNQRFASAIKRVAADAPVLGFVSYGWNGYTTLQNATDGNGRDFVEWYLDQAKAAEASAGKRLIDYLDLHWYPEAQGSGGTRITDKSSSADVVTAREQAPRSLWDTTYNEKSWIQQSVNGPINLVPRMLGKINAHYPGTKLSFSEWDYGGGGDISGSIAVADVLGVFGREGVSLATYWPLTDTEPFTYAAFRAYRNYDGSGSTFGDVSLAATSSDDANVTVYASLHGSDPDAVVIVMINKANGSKSVGLSLAHPTTFTSLSSYELSGSIANLSAKSDQASVATNAWHLTLPAQSVSVFVPKK
jgi:hypothetical protein